MSNRLMMSMLAPVRFDPAAFLQFPTWALFRVTPMPPGYRPNWIGARCDNRAVYDETLAIIRDDVRFNLITSHEVEFHSAYESELELILVFRDRLCGQFDLLRMW